MCFIEKSDGGQMWQWFFEISSVLVPKGSYWSPVFKDYKAPINQSYAVKKWLFRYNNETFQNWPFCDVTSSLGVSINAGDVVICMKKQIENCQKICVSVRKSIIIALSVTYIWNFDGWTLVWRAASGPGLSFSVNLQINGASAYAKHQKRFQRAHLAVVNQLRR